MNEVVNQEHRDVVTRRIVLADGADCATWTYPADGLHGVDSVRIDAASRALRVRYDRLQVDYDAVVTYLEESGLALASTWLSRVKRSIYTLMDQNAKAHDSHRPACCNSAPVRARTNGSR